MKTHDAELVQYNRERLEALSAWSKPANFNAIVEEVRERVGAYDLFRKSMWSPFRDASTLGRFAHLVGAEAVQLATAKERYPDGRVKVGSETWNVEVTEAMTPGRRRANEYAPNAPTFQHDPIEEWDRRLDKLPAVLDRVIRQKAEKQYRPSPVLVVYLTISAYGQYREVETRSCIAKAKARYTSSFAAIYFLRDHELM